MTPDASASERAYDARSPSMALRWTGGLGLAAFFTWRLASANYNGPHVDESLYYSLREAGVGNVDWLSGNAYVWPSLAHLAHAAGGLFGARALTALLITVSAVLTARIVMNLGGWLGWRSSVHGAAFAAAMAFCLASPTTVISSLATYDALAAFFYVAGLERLVTTIRSPGPWAGGAAAAFLALAAITRYFYLPLSGGTVLFGLVMAILSEEGRARRVLFAGVLPVLTTASATWLSWTHIVGVQAHLSNSVFNCCRATSEQILRDAALLVPVAGAAGALSLLLLLPALLKPRAGSRSSMSSAQRLLLLQFLGAGMAAPLALHLVGGHSAAEGRTLAVTAFFGSLAIGLALAAGLSAIEAPRRRLLLVVAGASLLILASVFTNVRVVDLGLRTMDAKVQATGTWLDARPAATAAVARAAELPPAITPGVLVLSADLNVWELRRGWAPGSTPMRRTTRPRGSRSCAKPPASGSRSSLVS